MTDGVVKTQGTELFVIDTVTNPEQPAIVKFSCPTGIEGVGAGTKTQIPATCLDTETDEESVAGLGSPGAMSVPFNFIPTAVAHQLILVDFKESGERMKWMVCLSDGKSLPTLSPGGDFVKPTDRTAIGFKAYVAEATIGMATNALVTGTMSLQRSGKLDWHFKE